MTVDIRAYMHEYEVGNFGHLRSFTDLPDVVGDAASLVCEQYG